MKLYSIASWEKYFENSRSRSVERLHWVPIPNRHDGENFRLVVSQPDGAAIYGCWVLIIQVAAKCEPRGTLVKGNGDPHTAESLSLKTGASAKSISATLAFLEAHTDWLEVKQVADKMAPDYQPTISRLSADYQPTISRVCIEGIEGIEGIEQNGTERLSAGKPNEVPSEIIPAKTKRYESARLVIHILNELTGSRFREVETNLAIIAARMSEPEVTIEGVKAMLTRQVAKWKKDPKMSEFLRPETLFGKIKFDGYYAARDLPILENGHATNHGRFVAPTPAEQRNGLMCQHPEESRTAIQHHPEDEPIPF